MSSVTKDTLALLMQMREYLDKDANGARVVGTKAFCATLQAGLAVLRKEDEGWWGVKLRMEILPVGEWRRGERGGTANMQAIMLWQQGSPTGTNAERARVEGVLPRKGTNMRPPVSEEEIERRGKLAEAELGLRWNRKNLTEEQVEEFIQRLEAEGMEVPEEETAGTGGAKSSGGTEALFKKMYGF